MADPAMAQEVRSDSKVKKDSKRVVTLSDGDETVTIEIENGRRIVNGEEIPEDADISDYLPDGFETRILSDDDRFFFAGPGNNRFRIKSSHDGPAVWFSDDNKLNEFKLRTEGLGYKFGDVEDMAFEVRDLAGGLFTAMSPEISKKEREARQLARQLRNAEASERSSIEADLDQLLEEIFDDKLALRQERLERQREEVQKLADELREREQSRKEIIERRKAELTGRGDYLEW